MDQYLKEFFISVVIKYFSCFVHADLFYHQNNFITFIIFTSYKSTVSVFQIIWIGSGLKIQINKFLIKIKNVYNIFIYYDNSSP